MGSLDSNGLRIVQRDTRYKHLGNFINRTSITGVAIDETIKNTSTSVEREKFTTDATSSGNLEHDVTRKIAGIHVSVSHRESVLHQNKTGLQTASGVLGANALGPMTTINEKKKFFLDSDRNRKSGFANWNIYSASGIPVTAASGTTDTDISPTATFDSKG